MILVSQFLYKRCSESVASRSTSFYIAGRHHGPGGREGGREGGKGGGREGGRERGGGLTCQDIPGSPHRFCIVMEGRKLATDIVVN